MKGNSLAFARYWRNSLADSELGTGSLKEKDVKNFKVCYKNELKSGQVRKNIVAELFTGKDKDCQAVRVLFRPLIYSQKLEYQQKPINGLPHIVTPIICAAMIDRHGFLYPLDHQIHVPRDILEPNTQDIFTIGSMEDLDHYLSKNLAPKFEFKPKDKVTAEPKQHPHKQNWDQFLVFCHDLLKHIDKKGFTAGYHLVHTNYWFINKDESVSGASKHILELYDNIAATKPITPLFNRYAAFELESPEPCLKKNAGFTTMLGHASDQFPLAEAQRDALTHLLAGDDGDIVAVNGPPGTGKTTMLLSAVASLWAQAALDGCEPPIILASSTNNQAVTNIIDAFGKDFATGDGVFAGRWLPDIKSFGSYLPSKTKEAEVSDKYQTRQFFKQVESEEYYHKAKQHYLDAAKLAFPNEASLSLKSTVDLLQNAIQEESDKLSRIQFAWQNLCEHRALIADELPDTPQKILSELQAQSSVIHDNITAINNIADQWDAYLAKEPVWHSLFEWIGAVKKKRFQCSKVFIKPLWLSEDIPTDWHTVADINNAIEQKKSALNDSLKQTTLQINRIKSLTETQKNLINIWSGLTYELKVETTAVLPTLAECDVAADTLIRFNIFLLTTHYWEGRWLLDMESLLPNLASESTKKGSSVIKKRWQRWLKLTPCVVSTSFMLPSEMKVSRYDGNKFIDDFLYNFADLLIVDEAGQVLPEVAGASFALAKKALVIGDVKQIEPIWSATRSADTGNLIKAGVIDPKHFQAEYDHLTDLGKTAAAGSVMKIAQGATRYHYEPELERGMYLYEHRRCFDDIINYCNELCYHGKLIPKREGSPDKDLIPAMGYLHINGICQKGVVSSFYNRLEAKTIVCWIIEKTKTLEAKYNKPIDKIIAVVTPFTSQVKAISTYLKQNSIKVGGNNGITVGTVHSLQGAERPIVIFSSVYSKHLDGGFIDNSPSMLNVAVSRAKDSFLVFGDMDTFKEIEKTTPRGILAKTLYSEESNELHFPELLKNYLCSKTDKNYFALYNAKEHDNFLQKTLDTANSEIHIVSPWIKISCMQKNNYLEKMKKAIDRGVKVYVYTDKGFNINANANAKKAHNKDENLTALKNAKNQLEQLGVHFNIVHKVHSKAVLADDHTLCNGSFNWFSAHRDDGDYKNFETSSVNKGAQVSNDIKIHLAHLQSSIP